MYVTDVLLIMAIGVGLIGALVPHQADREEEEIEE